MNLPVVQRTACFDCSHRYGYGEYTKCRVVGRYCFPLNYKADCSWWEPKDDVSRTRIVLYAVVPVVSSILGFIAGVLL